MTRIKLHKILILFSCILIAEKSNGQENLVPNPDFNKLTNQCNETFGLNISSENWFTNEYNHEISGYHLSCEYSNSYHQSPKKGKGFSGFRAFFPFQDYPICRDRMFLLNFLKKPLISGYRYYAYFFASSLNNKKGYVLTNNIGMRFFKGYDSAELKQCKNFINNDPQIFHPAIIPYGKKWHKVQGSFVASRDFNSLAIGNFFAAQYNDTIIGPKKDRILSPFYLIDEVRVYQVPRIMSFKDTSICKGDSVPIILKGGKPYYLSKKPSANDTFSRDSVTWVQPDETTNYYVNSIIQDKITVHVYPPPKVSLGSDTNICPKDTFTLNASEKGAFYRWNTGHKTAKIKIDGGRRYSVKVQIGSCKDFDTINIREYPPPPELTIKGEKAFCPKDRQQITLKAKGQFKTIKWNPFNHQWKFFKVPDTGLLNVKAIDKNGCIRSQEVFIAENCTTTFYVPNAFSPNGDGVNDIFRPKGYKIKDYELNIFNRFGAKIFETKNFDKGWDGTYKEEPAPEGIYLYTIKYSSITDKNIEYQKFKRGKVELIR